MSGFARFTLVGQSTAYQLASLANLPTIVTSLAAGTHRLVIGGELCRLTGEPCCKWYPWYRARPGGGSIGQPGLRSVIVSATLTTVVLCYSVSSL